jgi:hypothetical protein
MVARILSNSDLITVSKPCSKMSEQLFILASRKKFRFPSTKGELVVEQLWEMPLTSRNGFSVNDVAIAVKRELKSLEEESFVEITPNPRRDELASMLEILKTVIATRQEESRQKTEAAAKESLRRELQEAIATKKRENLTSGTLEELEARLAAI